MILLARHLEDDFGVFRRHWFLHWAPDGLGATTKPFDRALQKVAGVSEEEGRSLQVLEGDEAIQKNRDLMGATDPKKAAPGTIRADFATSIDANAVHGSDAPATAATEIAYFFAAVDLNSR